VRDGRGSRRRRPERGRRGTTGRAMRSLCDREQLHERHMRPIRGGPFLRDGLHEHQWVRRGRELHRGHDHHRELGESLRPGERRLHPCSSARFGRRCRTRSLRDPKRSFGHVCLQRLRQVLQRLPAKRLLRGLLVQRGPPRLHAAAEDLPLNRRPLDSASIQGLDSGARAVFSARLLRRSRRRIRVHG
jgi:hypothetical protein